MRHYARGHLRRKQRRRGGKTPAAPYTEHARLWCWQGLVLFERTVAAQAGDEGAELVLFDDHDWLKRALSPMISPCGEIMIIVCSVTWACVGCDPSLLDKRFVVL